MDHLFSFLLTLAAGGIFGLIFVFFKVPNGLRIGALLGAALLGIFFNAAWVPSQTRYIVQIIAGCLIGCTMEKSYLKSLRRIIKPGTVVVGTFLILNLVLGALIHAISPLDRVTSLMCVIPGGVTDIPIIAADMGADTPKVALLQLARYIVGVGLFPPMILGFDNFLQKAKAKKAASPGQDGVFPAAPAAVGIKREKSGANSTAALICTLAAGSAAGFIGYLTRIPGGTFLFSVLAVLVLKLKFDLAFISPWAKKIALLLSGCYIGSLMTMEDVRSFGLLALPLVVTLSGFIVNCFITGNILCKTCGLSRKEGMLATTPAGASDIALNSADLGVMNPDIIVIHVFRTLIAIGLFPQIINALLLVLP